MCVSKISILAIIGQGYVGLPLAMAAVDAGWTVIGVDTSEAKVAQINKGSSPIEDISDLKLQNAIGRGRYTATTNFAEVGQASVITICVPTPLDEFREPDLSLLRNAATNIAPFVRDQTLIVSESTSYPGTLREVIIPTIESLKPKSSATTYYASAPERVNPGDMVWNQKNTPRLIGSINQESQIKALEFYETICDATISVSSPEIAEAAKLLENTFRLVNIALINEFTQVCAASEINVQEVIDAASTKPYGYMPFRPGVGVGGHCIPVDPLYLTWWAKKNGIRAGFVELADSINLNMPKYVGELALSLIPPEINSPRILIFGVSYKSGVGDVRESPVSSLRQYLIEQGSIVFWHDPMVADWMGSASSDPDTDCELAIIATLQPGMDLEKLTTRDIKILDCTNTLKRSVNVTVL